MCGILGITNYSLSSGKLNDIVDILQHRGPDDNGSVFLDNLVFLGHRRLSIIDLTPAGKQPMSNENGDIWLTYNGEVYNFLRLRQDLEAHGHKFKSRTDAEVILHLYEEKGKECVKDLNGMFSFAIYDKKKEEIFLARDRLGIKPLYYAFLNNIFIFASEIKVILSAGIIPKEINWQAIYDYFSFLYVPCPETAFQDIYQLPPSHYLIFDLKKQKFDLTCYWKPWNYQTQRKDEVDSYQGLKQELRFLLEDAVKHQLISDVPLGIFLSGGIDSSIIAAIAAKNYPGKLKTFTVVFEGEGIKPHDDRQYAKRMSEALGAQHSEIGVSVSRSEEVFDLIKFFDQPFGNPTFYLSYLISKVTREFVKVAISGAGGDELFGGYPRYQALRYARALSLIPRMMNQPLLNLAGLMKENPDNLFPRRMKLFLRGVGEELAEQYLRWTYYFSDIEKEKLLAPLLKKAPAVRMSVEIIKDYLGEAPNPDTLWRMQYVDLKTFLLDNVLEYTDKMSMSVGLEARVPFLDHRLVELSFKVPGEFKIKGKETKFILRDAFSHLLPKEILQAPKRGFCAPISIWMEKHFDFYFDKVLTKDYAEKQAVFNWDYIQRLRREHKLKKKDNAMELFGIMMFDIWHKKYFS